MMAEDDMGRQNGGGLLEGAVHLLKNHSKLKLFPNRKYSAMLETNGEELEIQLSAYILKRISQ